MRLLSTLSLLAYSAVSLAASDWPQWLGPTHDAVWQESGVVETFPKEGLPVKWRAEVGLGYSGPAVAGGKVYLTDYVKTGGKVKNAPDSRNVLEGTERTLCFDAETGKLLWKHENERPYSISYAGGPRAVPAVAGGKVYVLGAEGNFWCLDSETGKVVWSKDFNKDYDADTPIWGFSGHPLVSGSFVYCLVGGEGSVMVAFDDETGEEKWRALSSKEPGYGAPSIIEHDGQQQLLIWTPQGVNSLDPVTGTPLWSVDLKPGYNMSIMAPRQFGDKLFVCGIGNASAVIQLGKGKPSAEILWRGTPRNALYAANMTPLIIDDVVYGCDVESSALIAARLSDGKRLWESKLPTIGEEGNGRHGTAFVVRHQDRVFLFNELGDLILAKLTPEKYEEISRFHVLEPTNEVFGRPCVWSHPAFADRAMFARNDKELVCVDLAASK